MDKTIFDLGSAPSSTVSSLYSYCDQNYTMAEFVEKQDPTSLSDLSVNYPDFIEFRTAYYNTDSSSNVNLRINFDDIARRKFLYDLNNKIKNNE